MLSSLRKIGGRSCVLSESNVEAVTAYISDQAEHHRKFSYQEELRELLKRHQVAFDERYLWE
jgi:putative transposase